MTETKEKTIGISTLNLSKFVGSPEKKLKLKLKKCPDQEACITVRMKSTLIEEDCDDDNLSQMSDLRSVDSGPDQNFDFNEFDPDFD